MPRKHRTGMQRRIVPETALKVFLRSGFDFFHSLDGIVKDDKNGVEILDEPFLRQAWRERKTEILAEYERQHGPNRKPWGYWYFDRNMPGRPANEEKILISNGQTEGDEND
jgi:hypothetical protein